MTAAPLDLVIKNVARRAARATRPWSPRPGRAGRPLRADRAGDPASQAREVFDGARPARLPGRRGRPHPRRASTRRCPATRSTESKAAAARRRHRDADLLPHRPVLSEPRRPVRRVLPRGAPPLRGPLLGRLRVSPRPDPGRPHRRDGGAGGRARRAVVQDLHVLRRLRAPREGRPRRPSGTSSCSARTSATTSPTSSSSCAGRRGIRERHPRLPRPRQREPPLRGGRHPERLHAPRPAGPVPRPGSAPTARRGRRTRKGSRCGSPPTSPTRPRAATSTCSISRRARRWRRPSRMRAALFPHLDFRREVTVGHLLLDYDAPDRRARQGQPADPAARGRRVPLAGRARPAGRLDRERPRLLRDARRRSPRASRRRLARQGRLRRHRVPALRRVQRGQPARHVLLATWPSSARWNPARRFGLLGKGDVAPGYDADLALLDPDASFTVRAADSPSGQGYTPVRGPGADGQGHRDLPARGALVYEHGKMSGPGRLPGLRARLRRNVTCALALPSRLLEGEGAASPPSGEGGGGARVRGHLRGHSSRGCPRLQQLAERRLWSISLNGRRKGGFGEWPARSGWHGRCSPETHASHRHLRRTP